MAKLLPGFGQRILVVVRKVYARLHHRMIHNISIVQIWTFSYCTLIAHIARAFFKNSSTTSRTPSFANPQQILNPIHTQSKGRHAHKKSVG